MLIVSAVYSFLNFKREKGTLLFLTELGPGLLKLPTKLYIN